MLLEKECITERQQNIWDNLSWLYIYIYCVIKENIYGFMYLCIYISILFYYTFSLLHKRLNDSRKSSTERVTEHAQWEPHSTRFRHFGHIKVHLLVQMRKLCALMIWRNKYSKHSVLRTWCSLYINSVFTSGCCWCALRALPECVFLFIVLRKWYWNKIKVLVVARPKYSQSGALCFFNRNQNINSIWFYIHFKLVRSIMCRLSHGSPATYLQEVLHCFGGIDYTYKYLSFLHCQLFKTLIVLLLWSLHVAQRESISPVLIWRWWWYGPAVLAHSTEVYFAGVSTYYFVMMSLRFLVSSLRNLIVVWINCSVTRLKISNSV